MFNGFISRVLPILALALMAAPEAALAHTKLGVGIASWYGPGFHGRSTANGERFDMHGMTAAHKTLPFNTTVRVTNVRNGRSVVVRINDRGPFIKSRTIDLSHGAAKALGMINAGTAKVELEIIG